ncbi:hypothetical protein BDQ17DRAFT_987860 [Cyathus striatus]|nr:hypothetical protein BDQ17DRAFT_987860 [Cyathus striatus]
MSFSLYVNGLSNIVESHPVIHLWSRFILTRVRGLLPRKLSRNLYKQTRRIPNFVVQANRLLYTIAIIKVQRPHVIKSFLLAIISTAAAISYGPLRINSAFAPIQDRFASRGRRRLKRSSSLKSSIFCVCSWELWSRLLCGLDGDLRWWAQFGWERIMRDGSPAYAPTLDGD